MCFMKILSTFLVLSLCLPACRQDGPEEGGNGPIKTPLASDMSGNKPLWWPEFAGFIDRPADKALAARLRELLGGAAGKTGPDSRDALFAWAIVERESGQWLQAEQLFGQVLAKKAEYQAGAAWNLGRIALIQDNLSTAERFFEQASQYDENAWQPVYALSQLKRRQGQMKDANRLWEKARNLGAGQLDPRGGMGGNKTEIVPGNLQWQ